MTDLNQIEKMALSQMDNSGEPQQHWNQIAEAFPWYPYSWIMLAKHQDKKWAEKASIWIEDGFRLNYILKSNLIITASEFKTAETINNDSANSSPASPQIEANIELIKEHEKAATSVSESELPSVDINSVESEIVDRQSIVEENSDSSISKNTSQIDSSKEVPKVKKDESKVENLSFEPYHVVDYFASQGIKIDINAIPKSQLDKQMKSFTQWLKTMKRLTPTDANAPTDPVVDAQANSSLVKEDVITEAMAEVLVKQGLTKKAIDVYEKLILLHPEKSTFFANRIKDLKIK